MTMRSARSDDPAPRVVVDVDRIRAIAERLSELPGMTPFDFTGEHLPPVGHERVLEYFFAATLQQFGFWHEAGNRYESPSTGVLSGRPLKGSDYLWAVYRRWLDRSPEGLDPRGQAELDSDELAARLAADDGTGPLPMFQERLGLARAYGRDLSNLGPTPADMVARANSESRPVRALLGALGHVGGYGEDPLGKKSALLAMILRQRPEGFLRAAPGDEVPAIVDYHVQRSCLRMGLVDVGNQATKARLERRELVREPEEQAVRSACREVMDELASVSGLGMGPVDWFFFQNRRRCPEMTEPECEVCPVEKACARRTELFQPVRRTTFY